jgi:hypothetical protein
LKTLKAAKEKTAAAVFATLALCKGFYLVSVCQAGPSFWADPRDKKIIEIVTVQDSVSVSSASTHRRFMRLKITKP